MKLNLIDVTDETGKYRRATPDELAAFRDALDALGVPVVRRYSGGAEIGAACGTLAATTKAARWYSCGGPSHLPKAQCSSVERPRASGLGPRARASPSQRARVSVSVSVFEFVFEGGSRLAVFRLAWAAQGCCVGPKN